MKKEHLKISELYENKEVAGTKIVVLKKSAVEFFFNEFKKVIEFGCSLEMVSLTKRVQEYAKNAIDNNDLVEFLKQLYKEENGRYSQFSTIIPIEFYSMYKEGTSHIETEFYSLFTTELSDEISEKQKIPEIDEWNFLQDWQELELSYSKISLLRQYITKYTKNPIRKEFIKNPYPNVFNSFQSFDCFKNFMDKLNALDKEGKPKRSFIAIANAIFTYDKSLELNYPEKRIFSPNVPVRDFVEFLNAEFGSTIIYNPNFKLSDGSKHILIVENLYKNFTLIFFSLSLRTN